MSDLSPAERKQRRIAPLKTGVYAKTSDALRLRNRRVRYLMRRAKQVMPWLSPSDEATLRAWCEMEFLCAAMWVDLVTDGHLTESGHTRRLITEYRLMRATQRTYARAQSPGSHDAARGRRP
jgi:hypothetical protein